MVYLPISVPNTVYLLISVLNNFGIKHSVDQSQPQNTVYLNPKQSVFTIPTYQYQ